jgi:hypothetical protein
LPVTDTSAGEGLTDTQLFMVTIGGQAVAYTGFFSIHMKHFRRRVARREERRLEQRLEGLEDAVQELTDTLRAMQPPAPILEEADLAGRCRELLARHVPAGERVAVFADPAVLPFEALGRPVVSLPAEIGGSAAAVARLEAQRVQGVRFLLVPEAWRWGIEQDALLAEHLGAHFRAIAGEREVGVLFEASGHSAVDVEPPALAVVIDGLGLGDRLAPILDWTSLGLARVVLPGRTLFRPVEPDAEELPYLDHTIDVVLVDDAARMDEAARVAADAVVRVAPHEAGGAVVVETRRLRSERDSDPAPAPVLILVATDADDEWLGCLTEAVAGRPGVEVRAAVDPLAAAVETDAPTVVLAERGVLPLPGCIEAAERLLAHDQQLGGVAVKLFDADGALEAAGGAAFADGSVAGIAGGAPAAAPWHEYVRPVDAAVGLVVLRSAAARQSAPAEDAGAFDLASLSAHLWSSGWGLHYQPDAAAVRVHARAPAVARPDELGDDSWRQLLAQDQVGVVR